MTTQNMEHLQHWLIASSTTSRRNEEDAVVTTTTWKQLIIISYSYINTLGMSCQNAP